MDKRFIKLFNLTEEQAISLLDTPPDQVSKTDSRYVAASHLINFPSEATIKALMRAVEQTDPALQNRIVRRKSLETLGRLKAKEALPLIRTCLNDTDCYTVENAVWAVGEIETHDPHYLEEIAQLLEKPSQTYRVIIHTLTKMGYKPALSRIEKFIDNDDPPTASAAISSICRLTGDYSKMEGVVAMLHHPQVLARRLSIQDLLDARYYDAIPAIARCPVSLVFRLRGIRSLTEAGIASKLLTFEAIQDDLELALRDHPKKLELVHSYVQLPALPVLIRGLYETDFGRCYLASKTIIENYAEAAPAALFATYEEEAKNDYGAHFHVIKLFGWLRHIPAYDLLMEALNNPLPQFQKSRAAAAIALGELGELQAIPELKACLETKIWDLKYAVLIALEQLGDTGAYEEAANDDDWLIREMSRAKLQMTS